MKVKVIQKTYLPPRWGAPRCRESIRLCCLRYIHGVVSDALLTVYLDPSVYSYAKIPVPCEVNVEFDHRGRLIEISPVSGPDLAFYKDMVFSGGDEPLPF